MDKPPVFWTTADGRKMNVDDMDDNHVRNAFKMLLRKIDRIHAKAIEIKKKEIFALRGEMAIDSIEQQINDDMEDEQDTYINFLCRKGDDDGPGEIGFNAGEFYKD